MTGTATVAPYTKPSATVQNFLPAVAQYEPIAPTSASFGLSPEYPMRRIELTSGSIDTVTALAIITAAGWLTAALRLKTDPARLLAGVVGAGAAAVVATKVAAVRIQQVQRLSPQEIGHLRTEIERSTGLSRQEIARMIGVDRRSLSAWVSGETPPSEPNLRRLLALAELGRRLRARGALELASSMRDATTAGRVTAAIRAVNIDQAMQAALDLPDEAAAAVAMPALTPEQWSVLVKLVNEAVADETLSTGEEESGLAAAPQERRIRLDPAAYMTPHRPRRAT